MARAAAAARQDLENGGDLSCRLGLAVDDLRGAAAELAVMVDPGIAGDMLKGQLAEAGEGLVRSNSAGADGLDELY